MEISLPSVSVVIPALNAADKIGAALSSITSQEYENIAEVIVAAGDDDTLRVAKDSGAIVVHNPSGRTPDALNLGIGLATGDVVVRCDAQSVLPDSYVSIAVETLVRTGAVNVGGMQVPVGITFWERAIAAAMASPIGAGDARYRTGGNEGPAETVYLGVFDRERLEALGGYDAEFVRNQDYELNHRIIESGGLVWFNPALKVEYRPRGSLRELWDQYFQYGQAKKLFARRNPGSLRWRQLAPPLLVIGLLLSLIASFFSLWAFAVPAAYLTAITLGTLIMPRRLKANAGTVLALATMHIAWGLGFLNGLDP
ncbi:MAG: glycosyltransferase family 2 protein [Acidimicrobiia bacterium]